MEDHLTSERMEDALQASSPSTAIVELARILKIDGITQQAMYQFFDAYRARHKGDADPAKHNAVLDTMDIIGGWRNASARLFDTLLEQKMGKSHD